MNRFFFSGFFSLSVLMGCLAGRAQDTTNTIGNVSIASPTAASLGKYGDFPVSYNTGLPQISIPIYTVKAGSLSLPISLSYHASGLKVQEEASWVGAGWSLNAGGMITRTVVGAADDHRAPRIVRRDDMGMAEALVDQDRAVDQILFGERRLKACIEIGHRAARAMALRAIGVEEGAGPVFQAAAGVVPLRQGYEGGCRRDDAANAERAMDHGWSPAGERT